MKLRTRILLLTIGLVALTVLFLSALRENSLVIVWLQHSLERSQAAAQYIRFSIQAVLSSSGGSKNQDAWQEQVRTNPALTDLLKATVAQTRGIVEISIAGRSGRILASSNPARPGSPLAQRNTLRSVLSLNPIDRMIAVRSSKMDYEHRLELGVSEDRLFTIQVLVSPALIREEAGADLAETRVISIASLLVATGVAFLLAQISTRPLADISQALDRISKGEHGEPAAEEAHGGAEFATVRQKLRILGEQFRGAQYGATQLRGSVEQLLEQLEEAIFLFDSTGKLIVCGEAASKLLGIPRIDALGKTLPELFPEGEVLGNAIAASRQKTTAVRNRRVGPHLLSLEQLPGGGMLVRIRDAESRQLLESQLNLSARLGAIGRLTGGVAHEIKNPLNSIALRLELLRARVLDDVPEAKDEIEIISQEITRLDRVVRTFLDFTRPIELVSEDIDLSRMTRDLVILLSPEAEQQKIEVEMNLEEEIWIQGDQDLLKQALMNVWRNALEVMPNGGRLTFRLRKENHEALLEIADTGPGIPSDVKDRIFQLYYSTKQKGTGIGLAMTYRAVQLHGGSIEAVSRMEDEVSQTSGATFRLRFPMIRKVKELA